MLKGGDPNAMLGVMKVLRIMLLRSKLFLLSPAPHSSNARGRWPKCCVWGHESPEDNAALSQTVLMPLANATYPMLKGSDPNAKLGP